MRFIRSAKLLSGLALLATAGCAAENVPPQTASAPADWLSSVSVSDEGGHIMGNPDAPHSIVEYVSYTCSHCSNFEANDVPQLKADFIANGTANYELRNLPLNAIDLTVAVLARCGDTQSFFDRHGYWLTTRAEWVKAAGSITPQTKALADRGDEAAMMLGIYRDMNLLGFAAKAGLTDADATSCLADPALLSSIKTMGSNAKDNHGLTGTPSFLLNGKPLKGVHSYAALKPLLLKE